MSHPEYRFYESLFCFRTMSGNFLGHADTAIILFGNQKFDFFTIRELSSHFKAFLIFENHFNFLAQNLKFGRLLSILEFLKPYLSNLNIKNNEPLVAVSTALWHFHSKTQSPKAQRVSRALKMR